MIVFRTKIGFIHAQFRCFPGNKQKQARSATNCFLVFFFQGSFKNYVDQISPIFDHSPSLIQEFCKRYKKVEFLRKKNVIILASLAVLTLFSRELCTDIYIFFLTQLLNDPLLRLLSLKASTILTFAMVNSGPSRTRTRLLFFVETEKLDVIHCRVGNLFCYLSQKSKEPSLKFF